MHGTTPSWMCKGNTLRGYSHRSPSPLIQHDQDLHKLQLPTRCGTIQGRETQAMHPPTGQRHSVLTRAINLPHSPTHTYTLSEGQLVNVPREANWGVSTHYAWAPWVMARNSTKAMCAWFGIRSSFRAVVQWCEAGCRLLCA
jgi:hypothetical protein